MPTYDQLSTFWDDWKKLTPAMRAAFRIAVAHMIADLKAGGGFRKGLRISKMSGVGDIYEMTFGDDWRATFEYGDAVVPGEVHVIWRRVGTHRVYKRP
ncbi:hypothetical protein AB0D08_00235 [Kitasatospora sp. NPDC048540]|uniref:hypothetical protein n=1 Tax=Kitasatospora sp. NPDC048540 TaxID=3155634 RepID=UPI0033E7AF75